MLAIRLNLALNGGDDNDALMDTSATYTGQAAGMSLHKEFDGQGGIVPGSLQSAAFTAKVELTATFGTAPTLGGTVSNFQGGATDRDWSVVLLNRGFFGANFDDGTGTTTASGQDGVWTAQGYGPKTVARRESSAASTRTSRTAMPPGRTPPESSRCITGTRVSS